MNLSSQIWVSAPIPYTQESNQKLSEYVQSVYTKGIKDPNHIQGIRWGDFVMNMRNKNVSIKILDQLEKIDRLKLTLYFSEPSIIVQKCKFQMDQRKITVISTFIDIMPPRECFFGDEFERRSFDNNVSIFDKEYWDEWETENNLAVVVYESIIYPEVLNAFQKMIQTLERKFDIIDLGCGSGKLASLMLEKFSHRIQHISLIDFSHVAIEKAKELLKDHASQLKCMFKDIVQTSFLSDDNFLTGDVIILSGVISDEVTTTIQSRQILTKCYSMLRAGGYVIVTSFSRATLNSKDYRKLGFDVLNQSITGKIYEDWKPFDFYILQKKIV